MARRAFPLILPRHRGKDREMASAIEIDAMRRALELARRGPRGLNPQVGAVILSPTCLLYTSPSPRD